MTTTPTCVFRAKSALLVVFTLFSSLLFVFGAGLAVGVVAEAVKARHTESYLLFVFPVGILSVAAVYAGLAWRCLGLRVSVSDTGVTKDTLFSAQTVAWSAVVRFWRDEDRTYLCGRRPTLAR